MAADRNFPGSEDTRVQDSILSLASYVKKMHISEEKIRRYLSKNPNSVLSFLESIKDPRQSGKIKYPLSTLVFIAFLTVCSRGSGAFHAMGSYAKTNRWKLSRMNLIKPDQIPSHDTFRRVFSLVDPSQIQQALIEPLIAFIEKVAKPDLSNGLIHIQLDGKEMRGTGRKKETKKHRRNTNMVNVYFGSFRICRYSVPVREKSNEIPIVQCLLQILKIANRVVTFDALHSQKVTAQIIHSRKGFYVGPIKLNQPGFYSWLEKLFAAEEPAYPIKTLVRGKRTFQVIQYQSDWNHFGFDSAKIAVKMISTVHNEKEPEMMYFIANTLDELLVLQAIELRWGIEGSFHQDKDSDLCGEDKIRYTDLMAQTNIVLINNLIAALGRWLLIFEEKMTLGEAKGYIKDHPAEIIGIIFGMVQGDLVIS